MKTTLEFAPFKQDTKAVMWFPDQQHFRFHRSHAFGKMNEALIQCFNVKYFIYSF